MLRLDAMRQFKDAQVDAAYDLVGAHFAWQCFRSLRSVITETRLGISGQDASRIAYSSPQRSLVHRAVSVPVCCVVKSLHGIGEVKVFLLVGHVLSTSPSVTEAATSCSSADSGRASSAVSQ